MTCSPVCADSLRETLRKEKAKPTAQAKAKEYRDRLAKVASKGARLALEHMRLVIKAAAYQADAFEQDLLMVQAEADLRAMDYSGSEQDQALNAKQAEFYEAELVTARLTARAKELKRVTEEALAEASDELKDRVGQYQLDNQDKGLDQIRVEQEEAEARLNCTVDVSHVVLEQYDRRATEVSGGHGRAWCERKG